MHTVRTALVASLAVLFLPSVARAQVATEDQAFDRGILGGASFGWSVAADGEWILAGDTTSLNGAVQSGNAFVFRRATNGQYELANTLTHPAATTGAKFGTSTAIQGDRLVIGAPFTGSSIGVAYVYDFDGVSTWTLAGTLLADAGVGAYQLGVSVALDGDRVVVGAGNDVAGPAGSGAVFVFEKIGGSWVQTDKLTSPVPSTGGAFGASVAVVGTRVVVGEPLSDRNGVDSGAAWVFDVGGPGSALEDELESDAPATGQHFGADLSLDGERVAVSASHDSAVLPGAGSVHVLERGVGGAWNHVARVESSTLGAAAHFGFSVALLGDRMIVGTDPLNANGDPAEVFARDAAGAWYSHVRLGSSNRFDVTAPVIGGDVALTSERFVLGSHDADLFPLLFLSPPTGTVSVYEDRSLLHGQHVLSISGGPAGGGSSTGSLQGLHVRLGEDWAGAIAFVAGSATGEGPTPAGAIVVPLTYDLYAQLSLQLAIPVAGQLGLLDAHGAHDAAFVLPPARAPPSPACTCATPRSPSTSRPSPRR
ncbi:MAG: FG-GAP repeat protein [Planctomycetota bacterium]